MNYKAEGRTLTSVVHNNGSGEVVFLAENVRYERTGLHAKIAILHNGTYLDYDVFNVERSEDRRRLVAAAYKQFGKANETTYPQNLMKADMDRFCLGLETAWQDRVPTEELVTGSQEIKPPEFLVNPLIVKDQPNLFYGDRSGGKSLTALIVAAIGALPTQKWPLCDPVRHKNPLHVRPPDNYFETLYLDWENNSNVTLYNMERLVRGMKGRGEVSQPCLPIVYQRMEGPLTRNISFIQRILRDKSAIRLIIYDSISMACGAANLNDTGPATELYQADREIGVTGLFLGHTSKNQDDPRKTTFGSFQFEAQARNIWECLKAVTGPDDIIVGMFHRKEPPYGRIHAPLGYKVKFDDEDNLGNSLRMMVAYQDPDHVPEFASKVKVAVRIKHLIGNKPLSTKDIVAKLQDVKRSAVDTALSRLKSNREIQESLGLWELVSDAAE